MAHGKSIEQRNIIGITPRKFFWSGMKDADGNRMVQFRNPKRVARKAAQLDARRAAKVRARANGLGKR